MSFGKLLAASKNIFGGTKQVVYRQKKNVYLPKFNVEKNPFLPKFEESNSAPASKAAAESAKAVTQITPSPTQTLANAPTQKIFTKPAVALVEKKFEPKFEPKAAPQISARTMGWKAKLNPFRSSAPVTPPTNAVQTEFVSLNAVKVLHNDLSDADVEVVPVKSRSVAAPRLSPAREMFGERQLEAV